jgi:serine/threonine protein phosphatase 1
MRKFWISDIHGRYNEFKMLLNQVNFNPQVDHLVIGGDMIDRGPHSAAVLKLCKELDKFENVTVLYGNHEEMMILWIADKVNYEWWAGNGGEETLRSLQEEFVGEFGQTEYEAIMDWVMKLPLIHEDSEYIYAHAGIFPGIPILEQTRDMLLWIRQEFVYASPELILSTTNNKKVVHGHTPRKWVGDDGAQINGDLGAGFAGGKLAIVNLTEGVYYHINIETGGIGMHEIGKGNPYVQPQPTM